MLVNLPLNLPLDLPLFMRVYRRLSAAGLLRKVLVVAGLSAALPAAPLHAQAFDDRDFSMAPPYCRFTNIGRVEARDNPAELARWRAVLGYMYDHMHHYCAGRMLTNRALYMSRNSKERMRDLNYSLQEFNYVINRAKPDYVLLPEFHYYKGDNLLRMGRTAEGIPSLQKAIELKPDYWPPYASLSDHLKALGDVAKAREWLEKGLSASPDAKALQSRLAELGSAGGKGKTAPPSGQPSPQPRPAPAPPETKPAEPPPEPQSAPEPKAN